MGKLDSASKYDSNSTVFDSYVQEAKVFDDAMAARWKVAMDGLILFAALFSAVVTAFIIESYKNLSRNSDDVIILMLYQVSQQLAALGNSSPAGTVQSPFELPAFIPPRSAIFTNLCWFLSLGLSLACTLIAILIRQWASDYIHAIERRQAAEKRARIRAFLFQGVENSKVGAIVEGVPLLLHASLFLFLFGLVEFIRPINQVIMSLLTFFLFVCIGAYSFATILPLLAIASPIRTPLTTFILKIPVIRNLIRRLLRTVWRLASVSGSGLSAATDRAWRSIDTVPARLPSVRPLRKLWGMTDLFVCLVLDKLRQRWRELPGKIAISLRLETSDPQMRGSSESSLDSSAESLLALRFESISLETNTLRQQLRWTFQRRFPSFFLIWVDPTLADSNLDAIRESIATDIAQPGFQEREYHAICWTFDSLSNDEELIPFLEGIPPFLSSRLQVDSYDPVEVVRSLVMRGDHSVGDRLRLLLYPASPIRGANASIKTTISLLEHNIFPGSVYFAASFLNKARPICEAGTYRWLELVMVICWSSTRFPEENETRRTWEIWDLLEHAGLQCPEHLRGLHSQLWKALSRTESIESRRDILAYPSLMALTKFWCTELDHLQDRLHLLSDYFHSLAFLATGTPLSQKVYASAMYQIALTTSKASETTISNLFRRSRFYRIFKEMFEALVKVRDPQAAKHAFATLELPTWWRHTDLATELVDILKDSLWLDNPGRLAIYQAHYYMLSTLGPVSNTLELSLEGCDSKHQIIIALAFKRTLRRPKSVVLPLLHLIATLDDPEAVMIAQEALEASTRPHSLPIFPLESPSGDESFLRVAVETLEKLKDKMNRPDFSFKALVVRDSETRSRFLFDWNHGEETSSSKEFPRQTVLHRM